MRSMIIAASVLALGVLAALELAGDPHARKPCCSEQVAEGHHEGTAGAGLGTEPRRGVDAL